jgi:intracellular septation protein
MITAEKEMPQGLKLTFEMGPLVLFFLINYFGSRFGLDDKSRFMVATSVFMVAIIVALIGHYIVAKTLAVMPLITAVPVLLFGGLTLYFENESFIKMKPTIVNILIALTLLIGLYFKKYFLKFLFGNSFTLVEKSWATLTIRYALFTLLLAALNEYVWRTQTTDFWVAFKVWGIMPLSIAFMLSQMPFIMKNQVENEK